MRMQHKYGVALVVLSTLAVGWQMKVRSEGLQASPEQERIRRLSELQFLAQQAISEQEAEAKTAIAALREAGPDGIIALQNAHESTLLGARSHPDEMKTPKWQRVAHALAQVGKQRDNWASRLYWFTDLEKAKAEARKTGKPILSLRLLGNLDDELSCANSRFFRTALYPNVQINSFLRKNFVLHWESVRPVPKVTIDFGDGRKIETTITGNSIHYALDSEGRVLDALPGLYSSASFYGWLQRCQTLCQSVQRPDLERVNILRSYHERRLREITQEWQNDIGQARIQSRDLMQLTRQSTPTAQQTTNALLKPTASQPPAPADADSVNITLNDPALPTARRAAPLAMSKMTVEMRPLQGITVAVPRDRNALQRTTTDELWSKIAALHEATARLDHTSLRVLRTKTSRADTVATSFQKSIAEDTVRNEYLRHPIIHKWLRDNPNFALDELNKKVYAEIFLTPDSDPWLGLLPVEAYTAIQNDGVVKSNE